jgi:uncharacterized protein YegP (UPF0339 family)
MATATKKGQGARPRRIADRASLAFVISQDNGGDYLWEIVDSAGNAVTQSGGFTSSDDAERAAHQVHDAARLAHFARRDAESALVS